MMARKAVIVLLFLGSVQGLMNIVWSCMKSEVPHNCTTVEGKFPFQLHRPEPEYIKQDDILSHRTWSYMGELQFLHDYENYQAHFHRKPFQCFLRCLKPYTVVFLDGNEHNIRLFYETYLPQVKVPLILVIAGGDESQPKQFLNKRNQTSPIIPHLFVGNCEKEVISNGLTDWITCIPIGLQSLYNLKWIDLVVRSLLIRYGHYGKLVTKEMADNNKIQDETQTSKDAQDSVLVSFNPHNHADRRTAVAYFCNEKKISKASEKRSTEDISPYNKLPGAHAICEYYEETDYFDNLSRFRFVVSPHGGGYDCYRTWETLLVGSYPIVRKSQLDIMYRKLPVLIVNNWEEVTPQLLEETYRKFQSMQWDLSVLYTPYWQHRIYGLRHELGGEKHFQNYVLTD